MTDQVVLTINDELQTAIAAWVDERREVAKEERITARQQRWVSGLRLLGLMIFGALVIAYGAYIFLTLQGKTVMPTRDHAAVIHVSGMINNTGGAGTTPESVNNLIERAFRHDSTRAVVLHVNSTGGSPTAAQRIGKEARYLADKYQKPLIVHIDGAGASAAYLLGLYADRIYASQYSLTGSVGAVIRSMNWHELADQAGIQERSYASADFKRALSPWMPANPEHDQVIQKLVSQIANDFVDLVVESRGERLTMEREELAKALIYHAPEALEKGLLDGIGTLEEILRVEYGLGPHFLEPRRNLYEALVTRVFIELRGWLAGEGGLEAR